MTINDRLKNLRSQTSYTLEDVAKKIKVSRQTVQRYESGAIGAIPSDKIEMLALLYGVSPSYIMGWEYPKVSDTHSTLNEPIEKYIYPKPIPLIGTIAAGTPILAEQNIESHYTMDLPNIDYALRVKGESMIDCGIPDGSVVFCKKTNTAENNDIAVCLVDDEEATLKRIKYYDGLLVLHPENREMEDMLFKGREQKRVKILGIAKKVLRDT